MSKTYRRLTKCLVALALMALVVGTGIAQAEGLYLLAPKTQQLITRTVKAKSIKLNRKTRTLYLTRVEGDPLNEKETFQLEVKISPASADANMDADLISYKSSKPGVATVDENGFITAHRLGKTKITVRLLDGSKKSASCMVTVKNLATASLELQRMPSRMQPGEVITLTPVYEPETVINRAITYTSSNKKVLTVSSTGVLTAVAPGSAKIKMVSKANKKAKCEFTVRVAYKYRLFGITNGDYKPKEGGTSELTNWKADNEMIRSMFTATRFEGGGVELNLKTNQTGAQIREILKSMAADTSIDDDSVTFFYYSGHGLDEESFGAKYLGSFVGVDWRTKKNNMNAFVTVGDVVSQLSKLKGEVVVIIDCCYSGAFITKSTATLKGGVTISEPQITRNFRAQLANQAIINAFAQQSAKQKAGAKAMSPSTYPNFHVLVASADNELSWAMGGDGLLRPWRSDESRSLLTAMLKEACYSEFNKKLQADKNGDKKVTLAEVYAYAVPIIDQIMKDQFGANGYRQTTQLWPPNDQQPIFEQVA